MKQSLFESHHQPDWDAFNDLLDALEALAPEHAGYAHQEEGPDDMPSHIKSMLTSVSLGIPVRDGRMTLGTWQGVYLIEHRTSPHRRTVVLSSSRVMRATLDPPTDIAGGPPRLG